MRYPEILARKDWYKPLPWLLHEYAVRINKDPLQVATAFWKILKPDETIEGLPRGYGMGVEISVMGNPRPAPHQLTPEQAVMGVGGKGQVVRQTIGRPAGTQSLSLRETMEASRRKSNKARKGSKLVIDLTDED
ncbi:hypothetical protein ACHAQA_004308 [Verticillium albo-atrum]